MPPDVRARKILVDLMWTQRHTPIKERTLATADFAYAKAKRYLFDPLTLDHDELIARTVRLMKTLTVERVSGAFLASLSSRRNDWRSGLASYVRSRSVAMHAFVADAGCDDPTCQNCRSTCAVCGGNREYRDHDLNDESYTRHEIGGVVTRHDLMYCLHDLTELARDEVALPTSDDRAIFEALLAAVDAAPPDETPTGLSKRLADVVPLPRKERNRLLESLAVAGVLVAKKKRKGPDSDWFAVEDWRGEDGYNRAAVDELFGMYRAKAKRTTKPKAAAKKRASRPRSAR